jgi:electron transport complex protein RnfD
MLLVIAALAPACITGVVFFGIRALWVLVLCTVGCVGFEALFARLMKRPVMVADGSALVTGILLGMNLSAATPWWICLVGCFLAIYLGKMVYGGLGYNPFNPALVGRVGLLIAFPGALTTWVKPVDSIFTWVRPVDAMTTATPLGTLGVLKSWAPDQVMRVGESTLSYWDCAIGRMGGCIGETSALALLVGGLFLIAMRIIRWQVPVAFIGTVLVVAGVSHAVSPGVYAPPLFHLLTGGLFLGAFFMATDMVTSPMTGLGAFIFGAGCGIVTCVIRIWGSYPEGVSFSILIMNALTPLIDRYTAMRPFGAVRRKEAAA